MFLKKKLDPLGEMVRNSHVSVQQDGRFGNGVV